MKIKILAFALLVSLSTLALAKDLIYTSKFNNRAVGGYDAVSYFQDAGPVKGKKGFTTDHMGAQWRFANQANLDAFKAEPEKYAPAYGGYCAWAVSQGNTAKGDPKQWTVHEGKLYLNYNAKILKQWRADKDGFIALADEQWPTVLE